MALQRMTPRNDRDAAAEARFDVPMGIALHHGGSVAQIVRAEIAGPAGAPVVICAGGISAGRHVAANASDATAGWWQCQARALEGFRVLAIDPIGADGTIDRPIDVIDQARAILAVLDHLGITRAAAFVGASYGAMVGMQMAALAPDRVGRLLAISAAHRAHPFASAQRALQRQAIELGERLGDGGAGVELARKLAILTYRSPQEFGERFDPAPSVNGGRATVGAEAYLDHHGAKHRHRFSAVAYRRLSESIDLHDIDPARIAIPTTYVAVESDALVPVADMAEAAAATPDARLITISSLFGHDAFLKEESAIAAILDLFLEPIS